MTKMRKRKPSRIPDVDPLPADKLPLDYADLCGYETTNREVKNGVLTMFLVRDSAFCSCGHSAPYLRRHDTSRVDVWNAPMGMPTRLRITRRRLECLICGSTESASLPEIDLDHFVTLKGKTWILDQVAMWRPFSHISDAAGPSANTIKSIFLEDFRRIEMHRVIDLPRIMGIDEIKIGGRYICVITDLEKRRVVAILESRLLEVVLEFLDSFTQEERDRVEILAMDMHSPYLMAAQQALRNAKVIVDHFHVAQYAQDCFDEIRKSTGKSFIDRFRAIVGVTMEPLVGKVSPQELTKQIEKEAKKIADEMTKKLRSERFILFRRAEKLSCEEELKADVWLSNNENLKAAHVAKENFIHLWDKAKSSEEAKRLFEEWKASDEKTISTVFGGLVKLLESEEWREPIFAYADSVMQKRVTNAFTEGVNSIIRYINYSGRGYSFPVLRALVLYPTLLAESLENDHYSPVNENSVDPAASGVVQGAAARSQRMRERRQCTQALKGARAENSTSCSGEVAKAMPGHSSTLQNGPQQDYQDSVSEGSGEATDSTITQGKFLFVGPPFTNTG